MDLSIATAGVVAGHIAPAEGPAAGQRLVSLDAFRGIAIVGMILVNNPGTWAAIYPPLRHAAWHGWTPTDLIFPFFLFIVGVAIPLAFEKRLAQGADRAGLVRKALQRAAVLFGLGLFMAAYPFLSQGPGWGLGEHLSTLRIPGVLQRIALCYAAAALLFCYTTARVQYVILAGLLLGYWALMELVPVPGYGAGRIDEPNASLAAYLDRLLLGQHLWSAANREWDPEGLLSTLPAIGTTLLGVWAGRLFGRHDLHPLERTVRLFACGVTLVVAGYVWDWFFPVNKQLWTSSFAVFTAGQAMCMLGLCYWLIDVKGRRRWAKPFVIYGVNAITVFVLSGILARTLGVIRMPGPDGEAMPLQRLLFEGVFAPLGPPEFASLLYALTWILGWFLLLRAMYRRGVIVKV